MSIFRRIRAPWVAIPIAAAMLCSGLPPWASHVYRAEAALPSVNIALVSDINTLDPCLSSSFYDRQILNNVMDKLFDLNSKGKIVPMLATKYKVSNGGLLYTLTLRKGVKFTDGTPFNAAAVKFNLDRYRSATCAPRAAELAPVQSVTTSGAYTVKVRLSEPFSPLISIFTDRSGMMGSPKAIQASAANFAQHPVATGPFVFTDRVKGDHITLTRNAKYWRKGYPKASQVTFKIFQDPNSQLVNLESGQVDFADTITSQNVSTVQKNKKLRWIKKPSYAFAGFWLNNHAPQLSNKLVRQAISLLIDRAGYVKAIAGKTATPADSPFGPGEFAYGAWDKPPKRDVAKAKQLLAKAKAGNVTFTFSTDVSAISQQGAQIIQSYLAAGGITMKIQTMDFPTLLTNGTKHNFEALAIGWSGRPDPDQNAYNWFISGGPFNDGQYSSKTTDTYLKKGRAASSAAKRKAAYAKVAEQLRTDVPYVFLSHANNSFGASAKLKGFQPVPDGIIRAVSMTK